MKLEHLLVLCLASMVLAILAEDVVVDTPDGPLKGTRGEDGVTHFLGVPYAQPPVGDLRFRPPQPLKPRDTPVDGMTRSGVSHAASQCPQGKAPHAPIYFGSEDCLYADIWVPPTVNLTSEGATTLTSVMVWIYGGSYSIGDSSELEIYNGHNLALNTSQVVVTFNYRLDVFGFYAHPALQNEDPDGTTGNYGLQDQRQMLKWVQTNIASLGGDKTQVTIFGESAGAFSICYHISSAASGGLFARAIMESPNCDSLETWSPLARAFEVGQRTATSVGCKMSDPDELLACLRGLSTQEMMSDYFYPGAPTSAVPHSILTKGVQTSGGNGSNRRSLVGGSRQGGGAPAGSPPYSLSPMAPLLPWYPTLDGSEIGVLAPPTKMFQAGTFNRVPVIAGTNHDEGNAFDHLFGLVLKLTPGPIFSDEDYHRVVEHIYGANQSLVQQVLSFYSPGRYPNARQRASQTVTDYLFACPTRRALRALAQHQPDVWQYQFVYPQHWAGVPGGDPHGLDIFFVFRNRWGPIWHYDADDLRMEDVFTGYWSSMAKTGDPNAFNKAWNLPTWPRFVNATADTGDTHFIKLTDSPEVGANLKQAECDFWDQVQLYHHP